MSVKIGARYFKTALAVMICVVFGSLFNTSNNFFSAIAAIITMQGTFSDSIIQGKNRIFGTFIGAVLGLAFALILPGNPLLIGVGVIMIICICTKLKWDGAIIIASILFLAIMIDADKNVLEYSTFRFIDTVSGVIVALLVNYFVFPHRPFVRIYKKCNKLIEDFPDSIDRVLNNDEKVDLEEIRQDILDLKERSNIRKFDLVAHKEDKKDVEKIATITEALEDIYDHLHFIEKFKTNPLVSSSSKICQGSVDEVKTQDRVLDFHKQQVCRGWKQVENLWQQKEIKF